MFTIPKPRFRDNFRQDLINNLMNRSNQETIQLYKHHIVTECVMYSCDMCLEFQRKSDGLLTSDWIEHITREVGEAIRSILPKDFNDSDIQVAIEKVQQLMRLPAANESALKYLPKKDKVSRAKVHLLRSQLLAIEQDTIGAYSDMATAIRLDPTNEEAYEKRDSSFMNKGVMMKGMQIIERFSKSTPAA